VNQLCNEIGILPKNPEINEDAETTYELSKGVFDKSFKIKGSNVATEAVAKSHKDGNKRKRSEENSVEEESKDTCISLKMFLQKHIFSKENFVEDKSKDSCVSLKTFLKNHIFSNSKL